MFKKKFRFLIIFFLTYQNAYAVVDWNSEIGINRLYSSKFNNDFYQLANFYQAQSNPILCSSATALIIKNSLFYNQIPSQKSSEITKPDGNVVPFNLYVSQEEFFNEKTDKIKSKSAIYYQQKILKQNTEGSEILDYDPGLNLLEFSKMLKINGIKSKIFYQEKFNDLELLKFREVLKKILSDKTHFIIANFDGNIFGKKTNGHISPIVAFDETSDSALILDVALHKNPWYWVDLKDLIMAMNTLDGKNYRGYLIVSKK